MEELKKCSYCKKEDVRENLIIARSGVIYHKKCKREYEKKRYQDHQNILPRNLGQHGWEMDEIGNNRVLRCNLIGENEEVMETGRYRIDGPWRALYDLNDTAREIIHEHWETAEFEREFRLWKNPKDQLLLDLMEVIKKHIPLIKNKQIW